LVQKLNYLNLQYKHKFIYDKEMSKKNLIFLKIFLLLTLFTNTVAKEKSNNLIDTNDLKPRYGLSGSYDLLNHYANFKKFVDVNNCCIGFSNILGNGISFGATYDHPLNYKSEIQIRADYSTFDGFFKAQELVPVIIDGNTVNGMFEHQLFTKISQININPNYSWKPINDKRLFLSAGLNFSMLVSSYFSQKEVVIDPVDRGTFKEGGRERNYFNGSIPTANFLGVGVNIGVAYELRMSKKNNLFLVPNIRFNYNFTNLADVNWSYSAIRLGLGFKYRTPSTPPPPPPPPAFPPFLDKLPMPKSPPTLKVDMKVVEVDSNGNEKENPQIKIEDFVSLNMRPLLNYIFFEENSAKLPNRYNLLNEKEVNNFKLKDLQNYDALGTYYHVLNIIGKRLKDEPSQITLIGCNANLRDEKGNKELSRDRAQTVKNYLTSVWQIPEEDIKIEARNLPEDESKSDTITSQQENMRVEIACKNENIIKPVITIDTLRQINKSKFRFKPQIESKLNIQNYKFNISQGNSVLQNISNSGLPPNNFEWTFEQDSKNKSININQPIVYTFQVEDELGNTTNIGKRNIKLEQLTVEKKRLEKQDDKQFEYYSLILFDYGKSSLGKEHKEVVDFVKDRIEENAKVYIYGYTDAKGEQKINQRISEERANAVSKRLNLSNAQVEGIGERSLLYDNFYPEGRFYCRTVRILVEQEVKK